MFAPGPVFAVLYYATALILVGGLGARLLGWGRTPVPLPIPTTPAPMTRGGVVLRMAREVTLFESLWRSQKALWLFAMLFHVGLLLVSLRHLRYLLPEGTLGPLWELVVLVQPFGIYGGMAMAVGLLGLLGRRLMLPRVKAISRGSDFLMLGLLIAIGASGLAMKFAVHTDIVAVKAFFLGLVTFDWQPLPADPLLLGHLLLVALLMAVFPFSKLLHAPGVFFSPGRNQVDRRAFPAAQGRG
ncbi:respiratory nitrate reductase subunit gamma [Roseospirillum parvum]|uniref:Nitrate reductase gamma subunit n=1 Tax=Roseospirillum parvum TaxID=83401 RepID=A0A1G7W121_9PROT|nr:respiratory nitrate reductase subunit gamma [Roseospirillum parvum]SDG65715.1 Nitrate reductase gamma subunit [Roseospirillum parvum]